MPHNEQLEQQWPTEPIPDKSRHSISGLHGLRRASELVYGWPFIVDGLDVVQYNAVFTNQSHSDLHESLVDQQYFCHRAGSITSQADRYNQSLIEGAMNNAQ